MTANPRPQVALEPWQILRQLCTPATSWHDEEGWKQRAERFLEAIATPPADCPDVVKRKISVPLDEWLELHRDIGFARGLLRGWLYSAGDTDRAAEATRAFLADAEGG